MVTEPAVFVPEAPVLKIARSIGWGVFYSSVSIETTQFINPDKPINWAMNAFLFSLCFLYGMRKETPMTGGTDGQ